MGLLDLRYDADGWPHSFPLGRLGRQLREILSLRHWASRWTSSSAVRLGSAGALDSTASNASIGIGSVLGEPESRLDRSSEAFMHHFRTGVNRLKPCLQGCQLLLDIVESSIPSESSGPCNVSSPMETSIAVR